MSSRRDTIEILIRKESKNKKKKITSNNIEPQGHSHPPSSKLLSSRRIALDPELKKTGNLNPS